MSKYILQDEIEAAPGVECVVLAREPGTHYASLLVGDVEVLWINLNTGTYLFSDELAEKAGLVNVLNPLCISRN